MNNIIKTVIIMAAGAASFGLIKASINGIKDIRRRVNANKTPTFGGEE